MAKRKTAKPSVDQLQKEYDSIRPQAEEFAKALCDQFDHLLNSNDITLGVPLEHRVSRVNYVYHSSNLSKLW